jgi:hypothetical protein
MATDALTPARSALLQFARDLKRNEKTDKKLDKDDLELSELAEMPGWKVFTRIVESMKQNIKPTFNLEGDDDDFFKSYGMRSVVYDIVSDQLNTLVKRVENARELVTESRKAL